MCNQRFLLYSPNPFFALLAKVGVGQMFVVASDASFCRFLGFSLVFEVAEALVANILVGFCVLDFAPSADRPTGCVFVFVRFRFHHCLSPDDWRNCQLFGAYRHRSHKVTGEVTTFAFDS